jgi:hypothetical protein
MCGRRAPGAGGGLRGRRIGGVIADVVEVDAAASRNCGGGPACGCGRRCAEARLRWWPRSSTRPAPLRAVTANRPAGSQEAGSGDGHLPAAAKCGHTVLGRCQPGRSGTVIPYGAGGQGHGVAIVLAAALAPPQLCGNPAPAGSRPGNQPASGHKMTASESRCPTFRPARPSVRTAVTCAITGASRPRARGWLASLAALGFS